MEHLEERVLLCAVGLTNIGDNIASTCSYTMSAAPNYSGSTDPGDVTQLTDGQFTSSAGTYWEQTSTVGWVLTNTVEITIDLGEIQPIQGVSFSTAGGVADVFWPTEINVQVSNDNINFSDAMTTGGASVDLVALDPSPPTYGTFATHEYVQTDTLAASGRYVKFEVMTGAFPNYIFSDEIEVYKGDNSLLNNNLALGRSYTFSAPPNYLGSTDPGDLTQLTDGQFTSSTGTFWEQTSTVGWVSTNAVEITIDLGAVQAIEGVSFSTAGGVADVYWPTEINVQVSNDNINWYDARTVGGSAVDLVALDPSPPTYGTFAPHQYVQADTLATYGRYVKFEVVTGTSPNFVFVDEIEVYQGNSSLLSQNVALGRPYLLSVAPNNPGSTDPGDFTQLTDGQFTSGSGAFWTQTSTVGWAHTPFVEITINLGQNMAIGGISYSTAGNSLVDVEWPRAIITLVSEDGINFYNAGEVVGLSALDNGLPQLSDSTWSYRTERLATQGQYVKIVAVGFPFIVVDEIEVLQGRDEMLSQPYQGPVITNIATFVDSASQSAMQARRILLDALDIQRNIVANTNLTSAQKAAYKAQLDGYMAQAIDEPLANNVVLPINSLHAQVFAVQTAIWQADGLNNITAWTTGSAWDYFGPTETPQSSSTPSISVRQLNGESRSYAINLSNSTDSLQNVYVNITGLPGETNPDYVSVQEVAWTDTSDAFPGFVALPNATLDPSKGYLIVIPAGMTRQVWLTFSPTDTTPGTYGGTITIDDGGVGAINNVQVPVNMRISSLTFPTQRTFSVGGWDETNDTNQEVTAGNRDALIDQLKGHGVDTTWSTPTAMPKIGNPTDFSNFDDWVARWPDGQNFRVFLNGRANSGAFAGFAIGTSGFNSAVGSWISAYVAHWTDPSGLNLNLNQIALLIVDEPSTVSDAAIINAWATAIKAAEPGVLVWENPLFSDPNSAIAQGVFANSDILSPNFTAFETASESYRNAFRDQRDNFGKTLEFYAASGSIQSLDPYTYYRVQAWRGFKEDAMAMSFWSFADQGDASSWTTEYAPELAFNPILLEPNSATDGKVMDAMREGAQDAEYLLMLKNQIATMITEGQPAGEINAAQAVLDTAVNTVLGTFDINAIEWKFAKDRTVADAMRISVLDKLEDLARNNFASSDFNQDGNINGFDFLAWQRGFGLNNGSASHVDGDADNDDDVDGDDLTLWESQFGTEAMPLVTESAVASTAPVAVSSSPEAISETLMLTSTEHQTLTKKGSVADSAVSLTGQTALELNGAVSRNHADVDSNDFDVLESSFSVRAMPSATVSTATPTAPVPTFTLPNKLQLSYSPELIDVALVLANTERPALLGGEDAMVVSDHLILKTSYDVVFAMNDRLPSDGVSSFDTKTPISVAAHEQKEDQHLYESVDKAIESVFGGIF